MPNQNALLLRGIILGVAALAFALGLVAAWQSKTQPADLPRGLLWPPADPLPEFSLIDHEGKEFSTLQLRGRPHLLFFGYTHCPDICPGTLAAMRDLAKRLEQDPLPTQPGIVFVTVDPERDTPLVLRDYISYYSEDFLGLTGPRATLQALTLRLGVLHVGPSDPVPKGESYLVDHSAAILLLDEQSRLVGRLQAPHTGAGLDAQLRTLMQALTKLN